MIVKDLNESTTINPNGYKVKKFKELLNVDIHKSLKECTTEFEGYKISFNYLGYNDIQNVIEDGTLLTKLLTRVSVESKNSDYKMSSIINLLNVPVENNVGITFRGRNIQSLAEYKSADGWSIATEKKDDTSDINEKVAIEMRPTLHYKAQMGKNFEFACKDDMISVKSGSRYVSLLQFLRVLTGKSKQDLLLLLGNNRIINKTINSDKHGKKENTFEEDINIIYELFSDKRNYKKNATKSSTFKLESIRERFLAKTKMKINGASRVRLAQLISFTNRAEGKVLGEDITVNGVVHRAGEILTTETLKEIDESNITRLIIDYNNKLYDLRKYKCEQDRLTPEEFFTVLNIYACTLDGFDIKGSLYDLTNRVEVSYTDIIQRTVLENVNSITFAIKSIISKSIDEETFDNSLCMWFLNKRGDTTQPNKLLTKIAENKQGTQQASDFVNTAALIAKDNKASADMKNATDEVTKIQDNQRNRTDPVDSPESSKIGLVHTLAFHTIKDENGFLVTPYLKVENGKVVSDKLYYLSALDEEHKYVASWDVDMESDNIHDKVTAYYDGTLVEVERTEVDYMEYSCLQAASFVRNLVPFPNFSNPKRLLMSANHHKQTIPTIRNERPLTDTGVSCLSNMGIITAKTILDNYFETHSERLFKEYGSKEEFLKCKIELISTQILSESRIYMFKAYGKDGSTESIEVMEHFMKKTDKSSIYTTNINKQEDFMYQGDDVVLFTSDMDINGAEIVKCVNYGKFTVEDKLFQYSMALGKNFLIGYRTTDSSNIDDAICINEDLIYDQSLSSVYAKEVKVELEDNSKYEEHLGFMNKNNMNDKIESSGLPKQGAVFAPGDMLIAKTRVSKTTGDITNQDSKPVNYYLDNNTNGCVTHAEPVEIRDNTTNSIRRYVVVGLAEISPIEPGDKLAGRCGNKGVVSKAVPSHEMPYIIETGEVLQITLNPLGIPSRMNIGQLLECYLSMGMYRAYQQTGKRHVAIVSPFHPDSLKFVKEQAKKYDVKPMMLRDGATGEDLKRPVNVGMMYMLKQEHIVSKKIHAISICEDPQSMNLQPKRGKKLNGGQKFGEMETWALLANNCPHILQMFMSVQSDDLPELKRMQDSILGVSYIDKQGVEHKREGNAYDVSVQSATNRNADVMQALARCLGMELTNGEPFVTAEGKPEINDPYYVPLTDEMIGNLDYAPSDISEESLHPLDAPNVRRRLTYEERKVESRRDWKYFNLETEIISPFWILDNQSTSVAKLMTVKVAKGEDYVITALSSKTLIKVLKKQAGFIFTNDSENSCNNIEYVDKGLNTENGVEGIVKLFKTLKVKDCMKAFCDRLNSDTANDSIKDLAAKNYAALKRMLDSGIEFSDYVISKFPILPENYRPSIKKSTAGNDLDIHYKTIFEAIKTYKITKSSDSRRKIFLTIAEFQGYTIDLDSNKFSIQEDVKIPGIAQVFLKKDSNSKKHNMLRETVLSKVMNYSGRSVIIPTQNLNMRIDQIGLPFLIAHKIWEDHIVSILSKPNSPLIKCGLVEASKIVAEQDNLRKLITAAVTNNQYNFRDMFPANSITLEEASELMFKTRQFIIKFLETRMCVFGRQPTLHKHGMRAYHVLIVESKAIQLHPLVCKGYNADFDGDQMYVIGMIDNESIREAKENLTPMYHVVNVKDGSLVLEHTQDMLLGNYFATMLYDNKLTLDDERYTFTNAQGEKELIVYSFRDLEELRMSVESSIIELQDICSVMHKDRKYISTAGRILFNSMFDDSFTKEPFDNPLKIPNINNGEFYRLKYDGLVAKKGGRDGYISLPKITTALYTDTVSGEKENLVDKLSNDQLNEFINSCKEEQILTQQESDKLYATDLSTKVIDRTRFDLSLEILKGANRLNISSELKSLCTDLVNEDVNGAIGKFFETEEVKSNLDSIKQNLISLCRLGASSVVLLEKVIDGSREPSILRSLEANIKLDFFRIIVATVVGQFANNGEYSKEFYLLLNAHMTESDILSVIGAVSTLYGLDDIQLENLQYNFKLAKSEALRKRIKQYLVSTEFNNYKKAIENLAKVSIKYRKLDLNNNYGSLLDRIVTHEQMEILEIIDFIKVEEIEFLIREFSSLDNVTKLRVLGEYEYDEENYKLKLRSDLEKRISYMEFVLEQQERQGEEFFNKILHSFRLEKVQSVYQAISVFGFRMSSLSGITLTLEDFERDTKVDDIADNCKEKIIQIDEFYKLGMITTKERNELVIAQGNKAAGDAKDLIKKTMDRNNNLFIISDSGSRGSDDQIAQSVGIIGVSMKTLTEAMETPILSAYATGLTPQEMNIASYGARAGVVSTQNSTPDSGYAARKTVMMLSGFKIVEEDCGKEVRPFKVKYGLPTMIKYKENGVIKTEESDSSDSIRKLSAVLGHKKLAISTSDNVIPELEGDKYNEQAKLYLKHFLNKDNIIDTDCAEQIFKHHMKRIYILEGGDIIPYEIRYALDTTQKSLFINRLCYEDVPGLKRVGEDKYITEETIKWINKENPDTLKVRLLLDCHSKGGCCSKCYGVEFDRNRLPKPGEPISIESAQAFGEPIAQMVMSLFHKGGRAGTSVSSGVDVINSFIDGIVPRQDTQQVLAGATGYIQKIDIGNRSIVNIIPTDVDCNINHYYFEEGERLTNPVEIVSELLTVKNGEYIKVNQSMSLGMLDTSKYIVPVPEDAETELGRKYELWRKIEVIEQRQYDLVNSYYKVFEANGIDIYARHLEILSRLQSNAVTVTRVPMVAPIGRNKDIETSVCADGTTNYNTVKVADITDDSGVVHKDIVLNDYDAVSLGEVYELQEFTDLIQTGDNLADSIYSEYVDINYKYLGKLEVVSRYSGILAAATFERNRQVMMMSAVSQEKSIGSSMINDIASGRNIETGEGVLCHVPGSNLDKARKSAKDVDKIRADRFKEFENIIAETEELPTLTVAESFNNTPPISHNTLDIQEEDIPMDSFDKGEIDIDFDEPFSEDFDFELTSTEPSEPLVQGKDNPRPEDGNENDLMKAF